MVVSIQKIARGDPGGSWGIKKLTCRFVLLKSRPLHEKRCQLRIRWLHLRIRSYLVLGRFKLRMGRFRLQNSRSTLHGSRSEFLKTRVLVTKLLESRSPVDSYAQKPLTTTRR